MSHQITLVGGDHDGRTLKVSDNIFNCGLLYMLPKKKPWPLPVFTENPEEIRPWVPLPYVRQLGVVCVNGEPHTEWKFEE